jgi:putative transposase
MRSKTMFLTCVFKLHNPSGHKRAVMDCALDEYTRAYQALLDWAAEHDELLRRESVYNDKINTRAIAGLLPRLNVGLHSSAKHSLFADVAGNLASYYALSSEDSNTGFPVGRDPNPEVYANALDDFALVGSDVDDYNDTRNRLATLARGQYMPLFIEGADGAKRNRYFSLLTNADANKLLVALWLLPKGHALERPINATEGNLYRLDTGEVFTSNSAGAILVPLEVGRNGWQGDKFLNPALEGNARVKTAFLVKRDDEYFLHVAFEIPCQPVYEPAAYLGIDKGILFTAAYAVVDTVGAVLSMGHFEDELRALQQKHGKQREELARNGQQITKTHYKQKAYDAILHSLANTLIDMAKHQQAGIVVEDLNVQVKGSRVVSRFRKLDHILEYKCKLAGVPFRRVFAAYSSMICHHCGGDMTRDDRLVTCRECGYVGHSDDNAAVNIARRVMYRKADWAGGYREFHRSFAQDAVTHPKPGG